MTELAAGWTVEKLAKLENEKLGNVYNNAQNKLADLQDAVADPDKIAPVQALVDACDLELGKRGMGRSPKVRDLEKDADQKLVNLAHSLVTQFDLSTSTAVRRGKAAAIPNFVAHSILGSTNRSKVGGWQMRGLIQLDRYISYRSPNGVFRLACLLPQDEGYQGARWFVLGPKDRVEKWAALSAHDAKLREALEEQSDIDGGVAFSEFGPAAKRFTELLADEAPKVTPAQ